MERHKICSILMAMLVVPVCCFPAYYDRASEDVEDPSEVQYAMCNVVTDQIKATANATITRQLKGVCHAKEVKMQLRHIEMVVLRELHKIHRAVQALGVERHARTPVVFKYLPKKS